MNIQTLIYVTIKKYLPAYFFLGLLINISYFVYPAFMLQVYNTALVSYSVENLLLLVLISAPLVFFGAYFESLRSKLLTFLGLKVKHELMLKEPILQSVIKESYLSKVDAIFKYFKSGLVNSIHDSIWIPVFIFGVYLLHSSLALSITILVILKIVADFTLVREAEKNFSEYEKLNTIFTIARGRFKNHVSFLRVNALESKIDNELNENYNAISKFAITEADKKSMQSFLTNCIKNVGQVGILAQGAYLVILGEVSPANMIVGTILFGRIMSVSANFAQSIINLNSIKRNFFREPFTTSFAAISQREKLNETGDIEVRKLVVADKEGKKPIIKSISFSVNKGEFVMITGAPASGKSVLLSALCGMANITHGHIKIAETKITPERALDFDIYFSPDSVKLLPGTILENITLFEEKNQSTVVAAKKAAKKLGVHEYIESLPNGYETVVELKQQHISQSMESLIIACRVIYSKASLMLLDDVTRCIPLYYKKRLFEDLLSKKNEGKTIILSSLETGFPDFFDKVISLQNGVIKEYSTKDDNMIKLRS